MDRGARRSRLEARHPGDGANMSTRSVWGAIALLICGVATAATSAKVTDNQWSARDYDLYAGDFNADGLDDILYVAKSANKPSGIALSDGSAPAIAQQTWASNYLGITWYGNYYKPIIGDYNADGHDDVFMPLRLYLQAHSSPEGLVR